MKSYEIRVFRDGNWKLLACHDERQAALDEARMVDSSGRFPAVTVVEETQDTITNEISTRTIFRDQAFERAAQERLDHSRRERAEERVIKTERTLRRRDKLVGRIQRKRSAAKTRLFFMTVAIVFCGIMGLAGLQYLREVLWRML